MITLVSVYTERLASMFLYDLLKERLEEPHANISHKALPTLVEHQEFVRARPYRAWYLIEVKSAGSIEPVWIGAIYLTLVREVGIHILRAHRGAGYGSVALKELRRMWPGRLLANINPANAASVAFFAKYGARHIQNTYEL